TPPPINLLPGFTSGTNYLICGGSSITVTATAGSTTNPWPYTYTWVRMNNPSPLVLGTGNSMVLSPTTGVTTYRVYADQGTPCVQQFDFTVTVNTFNAVNVLASSNPKYICPGEADTLLLWNDAAGNPSTVNAVSWDVTLIGGLPVGSGEFTLNPASGSSSTTGTVNPSVSTEYVVSATRGSGPSACTDTAHVWVMVDEDANGTATDSICVNNLPYSYGDGSNGANLSLTGLAGSTQTGTYTFTSSHGCDS